MKMINIGFALTAGLLLFCDLGHAAIVVEPVNPTTADTIRLTVSGDFGKPCFDLESFSLIYENTVNVQVRIIPRGGICAPVVTPWTATEELGQLPAGYYRVTATIDAPCCFPCNPPPCFEQTSFDVSQAVAIDIKPDSYPNSINPNSRGVIPVAILGSDTFNVADIDVTTLAFGPSGAPIAHLNGHLQDVNYDGIMDLVTHYRTRDTGIACGDESATLTGGTIDGQPIEGTDSIQTVGCRVSRWPAIWMKDQDRPDSDRRGVPVNIERK